MYDDSGSFERELRAVKPFVFLNWLIEWHSACAREASYRETSSDKDVLGRKCLAVCKIDSMASKEI